MQGQISSVGQGWRTLLAGAALLGMLLLPCAGASATMAQTLTFTSSPPPSAAAGGSYEVSATASSGVAVRIAAEGACSFRKPIANEDQTLGGEIEEKKQMQEMRESPATVYFIAAGTCTIYALADGFSEYEAAQASQSFAISKDPSEQITFVSSTLAGVRASYHPTVQLSAGIRVSFFTTTPSVCSVTSEAVRFAELGTCTVGVRQLGVSEAEPPEAEQSLIVQKGSQTITFTSSPPPSAVAGGSYEVSANSSLGERVRIGAEGACSTQAGHSEYHLGQEQEEAEEARPEEASFSPTVIHLVAAGQCKIFASDSSEAEYEEAPRVSQTFSVAKDPSEHFTFTSNPPSLVFRA